MANLAKYMAQKQQREAQRSTLGTAGHSARNGIQAHGTKGAWRKAAKPHELHAVFDIKT